MIHVVHAENIHLYRDALDLLYAARHQHFVLERGWSLAHEGGRERDSCDDDLAFHLIGFEPDHSIAVSCRVRPTLTGGVIPDVFPGLIADDEPPVRAAGVYECTRYFCAAHLRGRAGFSARSRLHIALVELMGGLGADRLIGFVDLPILLHLRRYGGLRLRVIGAPQPYSEGGDAVAFDIGVSPDDLEEARQRLALPGRQLFNAPGWLPPTLDAISLAQAVDVLCNGATAQVAKLTALLASLSTRLADSPAAEALFDELRDQVA